MSERVVVRWTSREWDIFLGRMVRNRLTLHTWQERIADAMNDLPEERRREVTSVACGKANTWGKELEKRVAKANAEPAHIEAPPADPPKPLCIKDVSDADLYAEVMRRVSLFFVQHASPQVWSRLTPQSVLPPSLEKMLGTAALDPIRTQTSEDDRSNDEEAIPRGEVEPEEMKPLRYQGDKIVFVGIYGKNAQSLKDFLKPLKMDEHYFDPDATSGRIEDACLSAKYVVIMIDRIPHTLLQKFKAFRYKLSAETVVFFQTGNISALKVTLNEAFQIV